jgi:hypothetical protein
LMPLMSFMEMLKRKLVTWEDIDDFIEVWHTGNYDCSLSGFLGMTEEQYALWVQNPRLESHILYLA